MSELETLKDLIATGADDKAATRALWLALGGTFSRENISNQSGEYREVPAKHPCCGYIALGNEMIAIRALDHLTGCEWHLERRPKSVWVITPFNRTNHEILPRALWMAVVDRLIVNSKAAA